MRSQPPNFKMELVARDSGRHGGTGRQRSGDGDDDEEKEEEREE